LHLSTRKDGVRWGPRIDGHPGTKPLEGTRQMAQSGRDSLSSELVYQGPLIGMKETKPKEEQETVPAKKPVAREKRIPTEQVR